MTQFASQTTVPIEKTRMEIERTIIRYGAGSFMSGNHKDKAFIQFLMKNRQVRFVMELPNRNDFVRDGRNHLRTANQLNEAVDQATKQRWRALLLVLKAKLESVESGISTFEQEFLSNIVLPNGQTAGDWLIPQIKVVYETGVMPPLLPGVGET